MTDCKSIAKVEEILACVLQHVKRHAYNTRIFSAILEIVREFKI